MRLLKPHYIKLFGEELGEWMIENFDEVNEQTLLLVNYLAKHHSIHAKALTYLALCINLEAKDIEDYVNLTSSVVGIKVIGLVNEARTRFPGQSKLAFCDFKVLSIELMQSTNQKLLQTHEEQLVTKPLCDWVAFIKEQLHAKMLIPDVDSTQKHLVALQKRFG